MPAPLNGPRLLPGPRPDLSEFAQRVAVAVLVTAVLAIVLLVLWRGVHVLLQAFAGVLLAIFLSTLSNWLSGKTGMRYGWALAVVVLGLLLLAGGIGWLLASRLSAQTADMTQKLPQSVHEIRAWLEQYAWGRMLVEHIPTAAQTAAKVDNFAQMTGLISGVASFLISVVLILFVGLFGAAEPELYRSGVLHLVPAAYRNRARELLDAIVFNLRWWLVGQVVLMVVIGVTTTVGLWALGVPLALTLGLIAGILELVPYAGPWLSAVPALLIALLVSPYHVVWVACLYLGLHVLEGYVLLPLVQRRAVHLPPALTLVAQVLLGELLGFMGLFVAAPLTVAAVVACKMLYVEDTLGDQAVDVPGEPGNARKVAAAGPRRDFDSSAPAQ